MKKKNLKEKIDAIKEEKIPLASEGIAAYIRYITRHKGAQLTDTEKATVIAREKKFIKLCSDIREGKRWSEGIELLSCLNQDMEDTSVHETAMYKYILSLVYSYLECTSEIETMEQVNTLLSIISLGDLIGGNEKYCIIRAIVSTNNPKFIHKLEKLCPDYKDIYDPNEIDPDDVSPVEPDTDEVDPNE